ncbi:uncharacterized protein LOC144104928 [Amblyomma americanum]
MGEFPEIPLPGNETLNDVVRDLLHGDKKLSQVNVNSDYVITWNGFFNVIEVSLAASLFLVLQIMSASDSSLRCLATVAFAMAMQGVHFLLCGLFSPIVSTAIATSVYYVSFHFMAFFFFFGPGFCTVIGLRLSILECAAGVIGGVTAVILGGVHFVHAIYCLSGTVNTLHHIRLSEPEYKMSELIQ